MASNYPAARWTPLGGQTESRMTAHDIICVHTMVGYLTSTDQYFRIGNGVGYSGTESHYGVGGKWGPDLGGDLDGAVWQWQDREYRADANLEGNHRVISIETADNAARPIQPWTPAQISSLIRLIAWECSPAAHAQCPTSWECHQVGIPPVLIPDTQPSRRGLGYHALGSAEYVAGERWSTTMTKDCPTAIRIAQFRQTVIPGVVAVLAGAEVDDVFEETDRALLRETIVRVRHTEAMVIAGATQSAARDAAAVAATGDAKAVILAALRAFPTSELSDEEIRRIGAAVADEIPAVNADAVIDALGTRIALARPATAQ